MNLRSAKFASVDLETTGLNPKKDEILAVGIVPLDGMRILAGNAYYTLVRPEKFKVEAVKIHGLDPKLLKGAPTFEEVADEIYDMIHDRILVGHAVYLDYEFLRRAMNRVGFELTNDVIDIATLELVIADRLGEKVVWEDQTLEGLAEKYGVKCSYRHNALADAFIAAQIFQMQLLKLIKYGVNTLEKMLELLESTSNSKGRFSFLNF